MAITSAHEQPQPSSSAAFSDAVTFAFGDPAADVYGVARVGLSTGPDGEPQGSGLAIVFTGREPVAVRAAGGLPVAEPSFDAVDAAGVRTTTVTPLREWTLSFTGEDGTVGFALTYTALSEPGEVEPGSAAAKHGGMEGYEQLCRVTGTAQVRGGTRAIDCLGQRGHSWGAPDWDRLTLARTVSAWAGEDLGVALTSVRPVKAKSHADEAVAAAIFAAPADDAPGLAVAIAPDEARLSTTYDGEGRQRRAGLEIYETEEGYPHRGAGDVICGTSLDLGRLRLDCAFFRWQLDGREGVGRYDILRRVEDLA
ncbi:hypothetical protein NBH00_12140 [Paraconexibacter antarcticus]|uniref:DUF7065 domain-containing protein n=1 Tax=Paraconexibacter antarcticus TaxID=2949664 RepID=A0ABY5E142_9ACTN|nr:hypothetical protein [Paraconexibacter antarcticus]UTI66929.1 hypothetical protein NBH00_12140 [Paraconexibacter antarcticus]